MISSSSDSFSTKLVAGRYDVLLDENPALIRQTLTGYLERFGQLEVESSEVSNKQQPDGSRTESSLAAGGYQKEFKQLRELSKTLKLNRDNLKEGELECNQRKNRYQDIIPFNHTRVTLQSNPELPGSGYINASFISGSSGSPRAYIACQGPLKRTLDDFWRMIWECNVSVVVMACNQFESGQLKCELYWPDLPNTSLRYGNIEVTLVKVRHICEDFLIRKFSVKLLQQVSNSSQNNCTSNNTDKSTTASSTATATDGSSSSGSDDGDAICRSDGDSDSYQRSSSTNTPDNHRTTVETSSIGENSIVLAERTICQFHYTTWPDHGVPDSVQPILELLRLVRDVQPAEDKPILVHCSAGCGRTGTICCIDYVWGLLRRCKLEPDFDLYRIISEMRRQRMSMVQTLEQYILCHRAVAALFAEQLGIMRDPITSCYDNLDMMESLENTDEDIKQEVSQKTVDVDDEDDEKAFDEDEDYGPVFI